MYFLMQKESSSKSLKTSALYLGIVLFELSRLFSSTYDVPLRRNKSIVDMAEIRRWSCLRLSIFSCLEGFPVAKAPGFFIAVSKKRPSCEVFTILGNGWAARFASCYSQYPGRTRCCPNPGADRPGVFVMLFIWTPLFNDSPTEISMTTQRKTTRQTGYQFLLNPCRHSFHRIGPHYYIHPRFHSQY